ncbi:MAG: type 4a pilus biogenesis protein PilO [Syntrophobacterales bacterium]|nr:type 4a pilus biogenesis protein PilO [Syntrophobacterales bacterium]
MKIIKGIKIKEEFAKQREIIEGRLKTLDKKSKILILVLTVVIICGAFWYFIYQENSSNISTLKKEIEEAKKRLEQLKKTERMSKEFEKQLNEAETKLRELVAKLPDAREIPSILENVSGLGSKVGLKQLILFEPRNEELREFHSAIPVQLEMVGDYEKMGIFFDELSRLDRVIKVRGFDMRSVKGEKDRQIGEVHVSCVIETYRYVEKPPEEPKDKKKK